MIQKAIGVIVIISGIYFFLSDDIPLGIILGIVGYGVLNGAERDSFFSLDFDGSDSSSGDGGGDCGGGD